MNLDEIQEMWERDATIDPDNLHDESLKIPQLHAKYYTIYNTMRVTEVFLVTHHVGYQDQWLHHAPTSLEFHQDS